MTQTFARIVGGTVAEIIAVPDGTTLAEILHADLAANCVACGDDVEAGWTVAGDSFAAPVVEPPSVADLKAYAALRRWQIETGGITVGGMSVDTDRASQAMITGAFAYVQANPGMTIAFKAGGTFASLGAAEVEAIANAVAAHVQACFAAEATVAAGIAAGTITDIAAIDASAWPA